MSFLMDLLHWDSIIQSKSRTWNSVLTDPRFRAPAPVSSQWRTWHHSLFVLLSIKRRLSKLVSVNRLKQCFWLSYSRHPIHVRVTLSRKDVSGPYQSQNNTESYHSLKLFAEKKLTFYDHEVATSGWIISLSDSPYFFSLKNFFRSMYHHLTNAICVLN